MIQTHNCGADPQVQWMGVPLARRTFERAVESSASCTPPCTESITNMSEIQQSGSVNLSALSSRPKDLWGDLRPGSGQGSLPYACPVAMEFHHLKYCLLSNTKKAISINFHTQRIGTNPVNIAAWPIYKITR